MAGSVILDDKTAVAFSSRGFDVVQAAIREVLGAIAPELIEPVYESLDVGCMPFIALDELDDEGATQFYIATKQALSDWSQRNLEPFPEWGELIEKLEADKRVS